MLKKLMLLAVISFGLTNISTYSNQLSANSTKSSIKDTIAQNVFESIGDIKQGIRNTKDDICNNPITTATELAIIAASIAAVYQTGRLDVGLSCFMSGQFFAFAIKCFKEASAETGYFNVVGLFDSMIGIASTCLGVAAALYPWCTINVDFSLNNQ